MMEVSPGSLDQRLAQALHLTLSSNWHEAAHHSLQSTKLSDASGPENWEGKGDSQLGGELTANRSFERNLGDGAASVGMVEL